MKGRTEASKKCWTMRPWRDGVKRRQRRSPLERMAGRNGRKMLRREDEIDVSGIKAVFKRAFEELDSVSGAKVGDKTMMDALIPASEANSLL